MFFILFFFCTNTEHNEKNAAQFFVNIVKDNTKLQSWTNI